MQKDFHNLRTLQIVSQLMQLILVVEWSEVVYN